MAPSLVGRVGLSLLVASMRARVGAGVLTLLGGGPFGGTAAQIPGTITAHYFDDGGEGVAYHDTTAGDISSGHLRPGEDVDTYTTSDGLQGVWFNADGENVRYTVDVAKDVASFDFVFKGKLFDSRPSFRVVTGVTGCDTDATDLSGIVVEHSSLSNLHVICRHVSPPFHRSGQGYGGLAAGEHYIWLCAEQTKFLMYSFTMVESRTSPPRPYGGTAMQIPGKIQAELFDEGGEGVGYHDTTLGNEFGDFRPDEDVDTIIQGDAVGVYFNGADEWLHYTADVTTDVEAFDFVFRVATFEDDVSFQVVSGGSGCDDFETDLSGVFNIPFATGVLVNQTAFDQGAGGLDAGTATIWLCSDSEDMALDSFTMTVAGGPYGGAPATIPGLIEAENFDDGGEGVGYSDSTSTNKHAVFRADTAVDTKVRGSGYKVGAFTNGEYLRYTVDFAEDVGSFFLSFLLASNRDTASFRVVTGGTGCDDFGVDLSGLVSVPNTGGNTKYEHVAVSGQGTGGMDAGLNRIWLCALSKHFNIDFFTMSAAAIASTPYSGAPASIPGTLEAEEFDLGGEGLAYSDTTTANSGNAFRTDESVDVGTTDGRYFVGWTKAGEYLLYTVDVAEKVSAFDFTFVVAGPPDTSGSFRVVAGGTGCDAYDNDLTGIVYAPSNGWTSYSDVKVISAGDGGMAAGPGIIRLCILSKRFNMDAFTMTAHM